MLIIFPSLLFWPNLSQMIQRTEISVSLLLGHLSMHKKINKETRKNKNNNNNKNPLSLHPVLLTEEFHHMNIDRDGSHKFADT